MDRAAVDHRGPEFRALSAQVLSDIKQIFQTEHPVLIYPSAGHGAWEAALTNICAAGDRIVIPETGAFSGWWKEMAEAFGIRVDYLPGDWRHGADPAAVEAHLAQDNDYEIKAVALVHNETSTGIVSRCAAVRAAIDAAKHPALFLVDTISSLASMDFRMDEWRVDVAVGGSQKGLMLPPGLSFTGVSPNALAAAQSRRLPRSYWDWRTMLPDGKTVTFPCTPAINMMFGLREALVMLLEETLDGVFQRHHRLAEATRCAVRAWSQGGGPDLLSCDPAEHSDSVTAVLMPEGHDANQVKAHCADGYNVVLGGGLLRLAGRVFRIGHLGDLNEPMILGTLGCIEASLRACGVPHGAGGVDAAIAHLARAET